MSDSRVARRYVQGFLGMLDAGRIDGVETAFDRFDELLKTSPDVAAVLYHPNISRDRKQALVRSLASDAPPEFVRFLCHVIGKKREHLLPILGAEFKSAADHVRGIVRGRVSSAAALRPEQQDRLAAALAAALDRQVRLETHIEPGLLAGMQVVVGSYAIDGSLKSRLERLHRHLLEETAQLKPVA